MVIIWIILGALLLWEIQSVWYAKHWDEELFVSLAFSRKSTVRGESCELLETIENRKLLPLPVLKVKFQVSRQLAFEDAGTESSVTDQYYRNDVFSVRPYTRHIRSLRFTCKKRGFYSINGLDVVAGDLFLTHELPKSLPVDSQLYVYPRPFRGMDFNGALRQLSGEVATKRHLQEDPFEYRGIREYQPQDDLKSINWKATARTGDLKVNQKNYTSQKSVRIFVNLEDTGILKKEDCVEACLQITTALLLLFLEQGMQVALYCNGIDTISGDPCILEAGGGVRQRNVCLQTLARIDTSKPVQSFSELFAARMSDASNALYTCFVSPNAYEDFAALLLQYQEKHPDMKWFYPYSESTPPDPGEALKSLITFISLREESV